MKGKDMNAKVNRKAQARHSRARACALPLYRHGAYVTGTGGVVPFTIRTTPGGSVNVLTPGKGQMVVEGRKWDVHRDLFRKLGLGLRDLHVVGLPDGRVRLGVSEVVAGFKVGWRDVTGGVKQVVTVKPDRKLLAKIDLSLFGLCDYRIRGTGDRWRAKVMFGDRDSYRIAVDVLGKQGKLDWVPDGMDLVIVYRHETVTGPVEKRVLKRRVERIREIKERMDDLSSTRFTKRGRVAKRKGSPLPWKPVEEVKHAVDPRYGTLDEVAIANRLRRLLIRVAGKPTAADLTEYWKLRAQLRDVEERKKAAAMNAVVEVEDVDGEGKPLMAARIDTFKNPETDGVRIKMTALRGYEANPRKRSKRGGKGGGGGGFDMRKIPQVARDVMKREERQMGVQY